MAVKIYRELAREVLIAMFEGTNGLSGTPSATPAVHLTGLDSGYTWAANDAGFASIAAGVKTGLAVEYDGEDSADVTFTDTVLGLADGTKTFSGNDDAVTQLLIHADHGAWEPLVCLVDEFVGNPFSVVNGETASVEWSNLLGGVFQLIEASSFTTDSGFYPYAVEQGMGAVIGGTARTECPASVTVKVNVLTSAASRKWGHRYLADIPDSWFAISEAAAVTVSTVAVTDDGTTAAYVDGDDETFTAATGSPVYSLLFYADTGDPATSLLLGLAKLDTPVTLNGNDYTASWLDTGARIFRMAVA